MIELDDIHVRRGRRFPLKGFNLCAESGRLTLLAGPNGAGKSSSLKVASAFWRPSSGRVRVDGHDITGSCGKTRRYVAYLPQSVAFHTRLKTRDIIEFYAELEGRDAEEADAALERFDLQSHARDVSGALSGGLRQRLGLAVLSLSRAPVLLLDEPGLSLDPPWRSRLQAWLKAEAADGRTVLVATHLLAEWEGRADACFLCGDGQVIGNLDPDTLKNACLLPLEDEERKRSHA